MLLAPTALAVLGGLILALAAIAPLTKSTADDKALSWLRWAQDLLVRVVHPSAADKLKAMK
jgi:hypothetical protein